MTTINKDRFVQLIHDWAQERAEQTKAFQFFWPLKGGWEAWIQVDLTAYAISQDSTIDILREQLIFNSEERVDILVNNLEEGQLPIAVEIKTECWGNKGYFIEGKMDKGVRKNGVKPDLQKFENRNARFNQCTCIMIAVTFSQDNSDTLIKELKRFHRVFFNKNCQIAVAVWENGNWLPGDK